MIAARRLRFAVLVAAAAVLGCDGDEATGPVGDITGVYQLGGEVDAPSPIAVDGSLTLSDQTDSTVAARVVFRVVSASGTAISFSTPSPVTAALSGSRLRIEAEQPAPGDATIRLVLDGRFRSGILEGDWTLSDPASTIGGTFTAQR